MIHGVSSQLNEEKRVILILHQSNGNQNTGLVRKACLKEGMEFLSLDVDTYPTEEYFSTNFQDGEASLCDKDGAMLDISGIFNGICLQIGKNVIDGVPEKYRNFVRYEMFDSLYGSLLSLHGITWMNLPQSHFLADIKNYQLAIAKNVGFLIPETIISPDPSLLKEFWEKHKGRVISKAIHKGCLSAVGDLYEVIFTTVVEKTRLDLLDGSMPVMFQRYIEKKKEFRVAVVKNDVFSCTVGDGEEEVDWRVSETAIENSSLAELPVIIQESCRRVVASLGLSFGMLDIIQSIDGQYYFLEVNQQGVWTWMESQLGLPISQSIVHNLS